MTDIEALHPALIAAARHGLAVDEEVSVEVAPSEGRAVLDAARFDRLDGLLAGAVYDGAVSGDDAFSDGVVIGYHEALRSCVALEALAMRTVSILADAAVDIRVLKGPALAHLDFADPSQRCFGDIDLLVASQVWERAIDALVLRGYSRSAPELRPAFERRFGKGATILSPEGFEIDLHRTFAIGRFGVASHADELFASGQAFELGGHPLLALSAPHRLLHACYHEAIGGFRGLRAVRDVAQLVLVTGADWKATVETATRWQGAIVVATALRDTWDLLRLDRTHPACVWALGQRPTPAEQAALRAFRAPLAFRRQALTGLATMRGVRSRAMYLYSLGVPSKANREARGRNLATHLRTSAGDLLLRRRRS